MRMAVSTVLRSTAGFYAGAEYEKTLRAGGGERSILIQGGVGTPHCFSLLHQDRGGNPSTRRKEPSANIIAERHLRCRWPFVCVAHVTHAREAGASDAYSAGG